MLNKGNANPPNDSNPTPKSLAELCTPLPQTISLRFLAVDSRHREDLEVIATLPSPKLQAAALDLLTGFGRDGCIPIIGEFGLKAKAIAPLLERQLNELKNQPKSREDKYREGLLNAALAAIAPEAFAARLKDASPEQAQNAVGAVIIYSLKGRANSETMKRLAESDVLTVKSVAAEWMRLSESSFLGEFKHISLKEGFTNLKVSCEAFGYKIVNHPVIQKTVMLPLSSFMFAIVPVCFDIPNAQAISNVGSEVLRSPPGTMRPREPKGAE